MMTVKDLISFLETQPQDLLVAFELFSEYRLLESSDIRIIRGQPPRPDGLVHRARSDKVAQDYLMFLGN